VAPVRPAAPSHAEINLEALPTERADQATPTGRSGTGSLTLPEIKLKVNTLETKSI
jgi:hypothetical protein